MVQVYFEWGCACFTLSKDTRLLQGKNVCIRNSFTRRRTLSAVPTWAQLSKGSATPANPIRGSAVSSHRPFFHADGMRHGKAANLH